MIITRGNVHDDDKDTKSWLQIITRGDEKAARGISLQAARCLVVSLKSEKILIQENKDQNNRNLRLNRGHLCRKDCDSGPHCPSWSKQARSGS